MINSAIILAGGLSKRYGKNKILELFHGKTLIEYNIDFLIKNNIKDIHIVYYDSDIFEYYSNIYKNQHDFNLSLHKRPDYPVGTGMSLITPISSVGERIIVLFGDNFYSGIINDKTNNNIASYKNFKKSKENSRFAAISKNKIVEKPHSILEGSFFVGYLILNRKDLQKVALETSNRGEIEITDIFNKCNDKEFVKLDIIWEEITYIDDYKKMLDRIYSISKA